MIETNNKTITSSRVAKKTSWGSAVPSLKKKAKSVKSALKRSISLPAYGISTAYKIKYAIALTVVMLLTQRVSAQYNDSTFYRISFAPMGSINKANGNTAYLLNNNLKFNIRKKQVSFNFTNTWIYGRQNVGLTNNDYSSFVDFNLYQKETRRFYYWGLVNYNTSFSLKIKNQLLAGGGLAYSFIDEPNAYLNISDGFLYDTSDLLIAGSPSLYHTWRNSFRLAMKFNINKLITIESNTFVQNSLDRRYDYIVRSTNSLQFKLSSWLSINSSLNYNRLNRTSSENLLFTYGLNLEKYF